MAASIGGAAVLGGPLASPRIDFVAPEDVRRPTARVLSWRRARATRSEIDLIDAARGGDPAAFEELLEQHRRLICDVCFRLTSNHHDAEDAVQAVQIALWRGLHQYAGNAKFSTWLYKVAYNTTLGLLRRRIPEPVETAAEEAAGGSDVAGRVSDGEAVRWALAKIPAEFRATLIFADFYGMSLSEIAEIQIVSVGTVKSRLSRARHAMRYLLSEDDR